MRSVRDIPQAPAALPLLGITVREIRLAWQIVVRDLPASVIPGVLMALSAWRFSHLPMSDLPWVLARAISYFVFYIYAFCLVNQLIGVAEDRVNKPDRPYARGIVNSGWMKSHAVFALAAFAVLGFAYHVALPMLLWVALILIYNLTGMHRHWVTRNTVFIGLGALAELWAAWGIAAPYSSTGWLWITVLSVQAGVWANMQDMRDVAGDREVGRRTAPIALGELHTRLALVVLFLALPVACQLLLLRTVSSTAGYILLVVEYAMCVLVALRLLLLRKPHDDHVTYQIYTYWYSLMCGGLAVIS